MGQFSYVSSLLATFSPCLCLIFLFYFPIFSFLLASFSSLLSFCTFMSTSIRLFLFYFSCSLACSKSIPSFYSPSLIYSLPTGSLFPSIHPYPFYHFLLYFHPFFLHFSPYFVISNQLTFPITFFFSKLIFILNPFPFLIAFLLHHYLSILFSNSYISIFLTLSSSPLIYFPHFPSNFIPCYHLLSYFNFLPICSFYYPSSFPPWASLNPQPLTILALTDIRFICIHYLSLTYSLLMTYHPIVETKGR